MMMLRWCNELPPTSVLIFFSTELAIVLGSKNDGVSKERRLYGYQLCPPGRA